MEDEMIYVLYALAIMWGFGCIALPVYAFVSLTFSDGWQADSVMGIAALLIGLPLGAVLAYVPWALSADYKSPDLVTLKKNAWHCTAGHDTITMMLVGKVMVPQTHFVCDQYGRL